MKNDLKRHSGMTLIEVMLAVVILSVGLVAMLTAISRCLGVLKISEQYHKAMWALSAGEADHPLVRKPDTKPEDYEVEPQDYDGILFERTVADPDVDSEDNEKRLLVLTTKLTWQGRGREQTEEVVRYVLYQE